MWSALSDLPPPPSPPSALPKSSTVRDESHSVANQSRPPGPPPNATCAEPLPDPVRHTSGPSEWEVFAQQRLVTAFYRGAVLLPGFDVATKDDTSGRRLVDVKVWNAYWGAFSDRFVDHIDDVMEYLSRHEKEGGMRRVLLAASLTNDLDMEAFKQRAVAYAHQFGALEHTGRERGVAILQFTCARAAETFAAWASSLTLEEFIGASVANQNVSRRHLFMRLVSHDTSKTTSALLLGEHILLPTAFVEGVFKGIFDAVNVTYQSSSGSFLITFESTSVAKMAVHSLQRSLMEIFRLSLTFSEKT